MIVALAGGVGGARLSAGLVQVVPSGSLTVIVNTADDFEHLGLSISPDIDTVMYTLAKLENPDAGWGRRGETWNFMQAMGRLGGETWFQLGDLDLATHIERTRRLAAGETLSAVTSALSLALSCGAAILPMSDDRVRTMVATSEGHLAFQDYFVRRRCEPAVQGIEFEGAAIATALPASLAALADPALAAIIVCPSNPYISIAPILAIDEFRRAIETRRVPLVAVSPIVGGRAIKGPAAKMMRELGMEVSALGIARHYRGLVDGLVIDDADHEQAAAIEALGIGVHVTDTIMRDDASRARLGAETLDFCLHIGRRGDRGMGRS